MKDTHSCINPVLIQSQTISADTNGTTIDLQGYRDCDVLVYVGTSASLDASNYWSLELEEADESSWGSDTAGTFSDVAEANMIEPVAGTTVGRFALVDSTSEDDAVYRVGYIGGKRFIRVVHNATSSPGSTQFLTVAIKGNPVDFPA